jgi:PPOX class probable F420-dependent enzyme
MDRATMRRRVGRARVGRLATVASDHRPHLVPCCFVLSDDTVYTAVDAKPKTTRALRRLENVRATLSASLLVDRYDEDWSRLWWVRVDGTARVIEDGTEFGPALAQLATKYEQYVRDPPPGPVIALEITGWRGWP